MHYHYNGEMNCGDRGFCSARGQGTLTCYAEDDGPEDVFSWRYEGSFDKGHATGQGTTTYGESYPDDPGFVGYVYRGAHVNGELYGQGTSYRPNGTKEYEGQWKKDYWHGPGTLYRPDGTISRDGNWVNGGSGEYAWEEGEEMYWYEGDWDNDDQYMHGWGILYRPGRTTVEREGWWQNGGRSDGPPPDRPDAP